MIESWHTSVKCNADGGICMMEISSGAEEVLTVNTWEAPAYMSCKHQLQLDGERRCNDCPQPQHPAKPPPTRHPLTLLILQHHPHPTLAPEVNLHLPGRKILLHLSHRNREMSCPKDPICSPACSNMLANLKIFSASRLGCHCTRIMRGCHRAGIIIAEVRLF